VVSGRQQLVDQYPAANGWWHASGVRKNREDFLRDTTARPTRPKKLKMLQGCVYLTTIITNSQGWSMSA